MRLSKSETEQCWSNERSSYFYEMNQMGIMFTIHFFNVWPILLHVFPTDFTAVPIVTGQGSESNQMILHTNFVLKEIDRDQGESMHRHPPRSKGTSMLAVEWLDHRNDRVPPADEHVPLVYLLFDRARRRQTEIVEKTGGVVLTVFSCSNVC